MQPQGGSLQRVEAISSMEVGGCAVLPRFGGLAPIAPGDGRLPLARAWDLMRAVYPD